MMDDVNVNVTAGPKKKKLSSSFSTGLSAGYGVQAGQKRVKEFKTKRADKRAAKALAKGPPKLFKDSGV